MAVKRFTLPDLGEGLDEAEILDWHVAPGERVVTDQPLLSVETDKAVVEIPAPWPGTLREIHAGAGETVAVGAPLAEFDLAAREDRGTVVGALDTGGNEEEDSASPPARARRPAPGRVNAMPAARALAARRGLDLSDIPGSGPGGVITRADVEAAGTARGQAEGMEPLPGSRRAMARNMARAGREVVPATINDLADVTAWFTPEADVLVRLVRAVAAAARAEPALNAWFDADQGARRLHDTVELGIAVDTEAGLYVPVVKDVGGMPAEELRREIDRLADAARNRRLAPAEREGATFTLSNFGPLGGRHAALVVSPPQVGILGAGRVFEQAGWADGAPVRRVAMPLSLSFDHRAVTGGEAARFLGAAVSDLELPD